MSCATGCWRPRRQTPKPSQPRVSLRRPWCGPPDREPPHFEIPAQAQAWFCCKAGATGRIFVRRAPGLLLACESRRSIPHVRVNRSEEHTSELQSRLHLVCRLLLEKKKPNTTTLPHV